MPRARPAGVALTSVADLAPTTTGWERRRQQVIIDIERHAFALVIERGYAQVTMADVAEAAGMSIRTVHRYFPLREDLLMTVVRRRHEATVAAMVVLEDSRDPLDDMLTIFEGLAAEFGDELEHYSLWMGAMEQAPELQGKVTGELLLETGSELGRHVARVWGVDQASDPRPALVAQALLSAIDSVTRYWNERGRVDHWPDLIDTVRTTLRTGFAGLPPDDAR
ncbi:TetR/AcrR family transcriptional regulator [soil metagenome]